MSMEISPGGGLKAEERALIEDCRAGHEPAWALLYRTYAPKVAMFLRMTLGQSDVDDLVQRVFLEFLTSLSRFRGDGSLSAWLHGIANNLAYKEIRSSVRLRGKHAAAAALAVVDAADGADRRVALREQIARMAAVVETLDLRFRAVWIMREIEGLSVEEVAVALGERAATVRTRHHRARQRVFAALEELERERGTPERQSGKAGAVPAEGLGGKR